MTTATYYFNDLRTGDKFCQETAHEERKNWKPKRDTNEAFWSKTCCPVSEIFVLVTGPDFSNTIRTQNTAYNSRMAYYEVALI